MFSAEWRRGEVRGRPPGPDDLPGYRALLADPEVARWLWWRSFEEKEVRAWHESDLRHWAEHGFGPWALTSADGADRADGGDPEENGVAAESRDARDRGTMVGRGGLRRGELEGEPVVELVWAVASPHQGRGLATTAATESLRAASELELSDVVALIESANTASCRVAERAGLRLERELPYEGRPHHLYRAG